MGKKEQQKDSRSYEVGQEIFYAGHRGGLSFATISKVGRRYCELSNKRLRLDMQLGKVVSKDGDWSYPTWPSREAYLLKIDTDQAWEEVQQFFRAYSRPQNVTLEHLQQIKAIIDGIQ